MHVAWIGYVPAKAPRVCEAEVPNMTEEEGKHEKKISPASVGASSGPLRVITHEGKLFVTGFGLWIEVPDEEEGLRLIAELEDQGFRICY